VTGDLGTPGRGLHGHLVERLGAEIASGALEPGTQVVPEDLGVRYGASRPVVREALRALEAKGMVQPRPRTGTRVLPPQRWNLLDQDVIRWRAAGPHGPRQLEDLSDLRSAVEVLAARRCVTAATDEQVAAMHEACDRMERAAAEVDHGAFTAADVVFHSLLLEASGNAVFAGLAAPFAAYLHVREDLDTLPEHVEASVLTEHRDIVRAIAARDPDAAERWARSVVERSRAEAGRALARRGPGPVEPASRSTPA
jgi:DNA-binding FadR family transcriptional regulator